MLKQKLSKENNRKKINEIDYLNVRLFMCAITSTLDREDVFMYIILIKPIALNESLAQLREEDCFFFVYQCLLYTFCLPYGLRYY